MPFAEHKFKRFSAKIIVCCTKTRGFTSQIPTFYTTIRHPFGCKTIGIAKQNDRFCKSTTEIFLHTFRENNLTNAISTPYSCSLIQRKKPTEDLFFHFIATLRGQILWIRNFGLGVILGCASIIIFCILNYFLATNNTKIQASQSRESLTLLHHPPYCFQRTYNNK